MRWEELSRLAIKVRRDILVSTNLIGSGHPGGSLSCVEILIVLYFKHLRVDPSNSLWEDRDYFILSKGHAAPALYSVLAYRGFFPHEEIYTLRRFKSKLQGHPNRLTTCGVEVSTGSLGQGFSIACGIAAGLKLKGKKLQRVYVVLGDGEIQEGQVWEAAMSASHYKLDNLIAILDYNKLQIDGRVNEVMNLEPLVQKWEAFGWEVVEVDGHSFEELDKAISFLKERNNLKPHIIIAHTIKGKGISFMEHQLKYHGKPLTNEELVKALEELEKYEERVS